MKFGKTFESHLTVEWREQYMRYGDLKHMIRRGLEDAPSTILAEEYAIQSYYRAFEERFLMECQLELTRVDNFFLEKLMEAKRKHGHLKLQLLAFSRAPGYTGSEVSMLSQQGSNPSQGSKYQARNLTAPKKTMTHGQLSTAYCEFYLSLVLIQNYQTLNETGFRKICKKFDKNLRTTSAGSWFENNVEDAVFTDSRFLQRMIREVEDLYTTHLAGGNRQLAMAKLRVPPLGKPSSPTMVFQAGFALGMLLMLFLGTAISYWKRPPSAVNTATFMSLYRGPLTWVIFNLYMAANVAGWQRAGVNHILIFEIDPRNHMQPARYLEIASIFGILWTLSMLGFLHHRAMHLNDPFVFPLALILIMTGLLVMPLPILDLKARWWTIKLLGRVITAPLHYVGFADFWMGDQLNSLVNCLVDHYIMVRFFVVCWLRREQSSQCFHLDVIVVPIVRCLPAWFRFAQCLRRFRDSGSKSVSYLFNAGKYSMSFLVVLFDTLRQRSEGRHGSPFSNPYTWLFLVSSMAATIYGYLWDVLRDFGLFQIMDGPGIFLRQQLVYPQAFYYFVIVENFCLRWLWAVEFGIFYNNLIAPYNLRTITSIAEITRRFIWNYVRLENEHLYNCGRFRATRDIHLAQLNPRQQRMLESMMDESDGVSNRRKPEARDHLSKEYF
ncbi:xenotropic and polytropic retrovirus receptor 1 homolog isoform X1 [Drosophila kikkawai]|uniref:Xenotropic and polytropic retrovirus receptor 1 homolog isoform X1 n=2 Tax=Drosophila kikkawai TaxID=30033 RepID=A0A6P4IJ52_DROKI|nr:xenotropic and polytropic retrovirus receptor 1 homolog [Drosophila kikkawai]